jgi:hypothetical protein
MASGETEELAGKEGMSSLIKKEIKRTEMIQAKPMAQIGGRNVFSLFSGRWFFSVCSSRRAIKVSLIFSSFDLDNSSLAFSWTASSRNRCKTFFYFSPIEEIPRISSRVFIIVSFNFLSIG